MRTTSLPLCIIALTLGTIVVGCSSDSTAEKNAGGQAAVGGTKATDGSGGAPAVGGQSSDSSSTGNGGTGGELATSSSQFAGGTTSSGGATGSTGGASAAGGNATGGTKAAGGTKATGGSAAGGNAAGGNTAGGSAAGGNAAGGNAAGGNAAGGNTAGGTKAAGGNAAGGNAAGGNAAGGNATGGAAGGAAAGATATGGAGGAAPGCTPPSTYTNLFVSVSGKTQADTDTKVNAAWNQLFNPSNANTVYYDGPGSDESYVKDTGNNDVRTEGMSYGMMTAVQLDKQTQFDRLWTWVKNHMAQNCTTSGCTGQIAWQCSTSGSKMSTGGAPDGEEYMATALIFAHNRWGDTGKINYATEAQWVLDLLRKTYFNSTYHLVQFVAGSGNVDASYVLPAFYQVWACFDTANAAYWNEAVTAARSFFQAAADSNGVIGDRQSFTGSTQQGAGSDAKRCVMNIMMDHNFFAADPWQSTTYAPKFASYMSSHSDGSAAQFSCNALLGFGVPAATGKPFVDKLWSAAIPTGTYRYYDGTLYMLGMLHVSGTFKLWF